MYRMDLDLAKECIRIYNEEKKYESNREQEIVLKRLFTEYPNNNNISDVLLKVVALNDFYSTNIMNVYIVARHILNINIDESLQNHKMDIVPVIAKVNFGEDKGIKCFYSFATKYCSMHFPNDYPIIDSHVKNVLKTYRTDNYYKFKNKDLTNYDTYCKIISAFNSFYDLNLPLRDLDHVLWIYDKEKDDLLKNFLAKRCQ